MELLEIPAFIVQQGIRMEFANAAVYERLFSEDYDRQTQVQIALSTLNGEDRYRWFCKDYADIVDVVPQNYIASFLGLQPQSLSRIKRQMKERETD